jgi:hypothetical protein
VAAACLREIIRLLPAQRVLVDVRKEDQIRQPKPSVRERASGKLQGSLPIFQR